MIEARDGDLLLIDIGAEWNMYSADITRTIPVNGAFSDFQRQVYTLVLETQEMLINSLKPGMPITELRSLSNTHLWKGLLQLGIIQEEKEGIQYTIHSPTHHLGLDTHDASHYSTLQPGMVITIEPGIYIPEQQCGIRIEDDVLITETGCEVLSKHIPKSIDAIEHIMQHRQ